MGSNKYYRRYIEKMVESNPVDIIITRLTKEDDGFGGVDEQEITLPPQTVTFYNRKARREYVSEAGTTIGFMSSSVEKILATADTDILEKDEFTHTGREYRVSFVNDYMGICKQAEVAVIK